MDEKLQYFGASWCGDCRRALRVINAENVDYIHYDVENDPRAAERAQEISGRKNIPVILFPDGTHMVEPSNPELTAKIRELHLDGTRN